MCLIAYKPVGETIPEDHLLAAAGINPHGVGVSIRRPGHRNIGCWRALDLADFGGAWQEWAGDPDIETVFHFRLATHGSATLANVHPFRTAHGYYLHHNGIIQHVTPVGDQTDSQAFVEQVLDLLTAADFQRPDVIANIGKEIAGSKLAIHTPSGVILVNESAGVWENGVWYSNRGYERSTRWGGLWDDFDADTDWDEYCTDELLADLNDRLPGYDPIWKQSILEEIQHYLLWMPSDRKKKGRADERV